MYLQTSVINKYCELVNKVKTQNLSEKEVIFKINMDLDLGKRVYTFNNGDYLIQYFDLVFKVSGFRVVSLYRDRYNKKIHVSESDKKEYLAEIERECA